ncbi:MAG: TorD/DmsD family molecular chaperone [Nitrososphaerales archaeon]
MKAITSPHFFSESFMIQSAEIAKTRSTLYSLFTVVFLYPNERLIQSLKSDGYLKGLEAMLNELHLLGKGAFTLEKINAYAARLNSSELLLDLQKEYTRLFIPSRPGHPAPICPLYESVYEERSLMGEAAFQVARLFYKAGLKKVDEFNLPHDHFALELEFMSYLCAKEAEGLELGNEPIITKSKELQLTMLKEHLGKFSFQLLESVQAHSQNDFYTLMASLLQCFLTNESKIL